MIRRDHEKDHNGKEDYNTLIVIDQGRDLLVNRESIWRNWWVNPIVAAQNLDEIVKALSRVLALLSWNPSLYCQILLPFQKEKGGGKKWGGGGVVGTSFNEFGDGWNES